MASFNLFSERVNDFDSELCMEQQSELEGQLPGKDFREVFSNTS